MKTKRMLSVWLLLVGLLSGRDALAFYNPSTGRWLNRDPIGELGGQNLYDFVANTPVGGIDAHGESPELGMGTVLAQPLSDGGTAKATIVRHFHARGEKQQAAKALCLIRKLIGTIYLPVWSDFYLVELNLPGKAVQVNGYTFEYQRRGTLSITPLPSPPPANGNRWSVFDHNQVEQFMKAENTTGMIQIGTLLAHESDHYHTGSSETTAWNRVNKAVSEAVRKATQEKVDACCINGRWRIKNLLDLYACECGIVHSRRGTE